MAAVLLEDALMSGFQRPSAQNKAYDTCPQLDRHITGTQNGIWVIEGPVPTISTAAGTEPHHARSSQLLQHLPQPGMHLGKNAHVGVAVDILVTLQGGGIQHMAQLAQPDGVTQQVLQDGHGDGVSTETEGRELGAAAQDRQDSSELVVHDPTLIQVQVLEGGRGSL